MRIDENKYITAMYGNNLINKTDVEFKENKNNVFSSKGADAVEISKEAREAYESYALNKKASKGDRKVRDEFIQYLDNAKKAQKTPEERLKELQDKVKKLQNEMGKIASDESMPQEIKQANMKALNSKINAVMKEIAAVYEEMVKAASSGA